MAGKTVAVLTAKQVENLAEGFHFAGCCQGLALRVKATGTRSWFLRATINGKRSDVGLGSYPDLSLAEARKKGMAMRASIATGKNPLEERRSAKTIKEVMTFRRAAEATIAMKAPSFRNPKHLAQWRSTLEQYAFPVVGDLPVEKVELRHVLKILEPVWQTRTETASRLRGRIEAVLNWARARKYCSGENPAAWRGNLDALLPQASKVQKVIHQPAIHYDRVAEYLADLAKVRGVGALCLRFTILTACRSGEARGATWEEIDLTKWIWTIPAERMKAGKEHVIPLSDQAMAVLVIVPRMAGSNLAFTSPQGKRFSDMALNQITRSDAMAGRYGHHVPHGFRSTFRVWAGDTTAHPREVMEHALAHQIRDQAEAAYARGTLLEKRRLLMNEWGQYCTRLVSCHASNVG